jgi:hypothetical protein
MARRMARGDVPWDMGHGGLALGCRGPSRNAWLGGLAAERRQLRRTLSRRVPVKRAFGLAGYCGSLRSASVREVVKIPPSLPLPEREAATGETGAGGARDRHALRAR